MRRWKKKQLNSGDILVSLRSWRLQDSKKIPVINSLNAIVHMHLQTQRNYPASIANPQPHFLKIRFSGK